ncbi:MAG: zinc ribbon domain-containing protein [Muribaculum sp.]|nr:zinc ribbon domain-containing protein [Muribaculum sp.]
MAIIECPCCKGQISDRAQRCVHCGTVFLPKELYTERICAECGAALASGTTVCPQCGCPADADGRAGMSKSVRTQTEAVSQRAHKSRLFIALLSVFLVLGTAAIIGIGLYQVKRTVEEAGARIQQRAYSENLALASSTMLSGAANAESCCNLIKQVWYNAIYQKEDDATDKYTKPNGVFVTDFNDALANLYDDPVFVDQTMDIRENQQTVLSTVKKLQNPPETYQAAYESLSACYDAYLELTNLAVNPIGSYNTFSADSDDAVTEFMRCYQTLMLYLPDEQP